MSNRSNVIIVLLGLGTFLATGLAHAGETGRSVRSPAELLEYMLNKAETGSKQQGLRNMSAKAGPVARMGGDGVIFGRKSGRSGTDEETAPRAPGKWHAHIDVTGKLGTERSLSRALVVLPLWQNERTLIFADLRGVLDDNDAAERNLGMGVRRLVRVAQHVPYLVKRDERLVLGGYIFHDRRRSAFDNIFHQAVAGAEILDEDWGLRLNAYYPEQSAPIVARTGGGGGSSISLSGNGVIESGGGATVRREFALPGMDIESSARLAQRGDHELWGHAGYFHFDRSETPTVAGPRLRAEYRWDDPLDWSGARVSAGVEYQDDDVRGEQGFANLRLRIPLQNFRGGADSNDGTTDSLSPIEERMTARIRRDVDIVTDNVQTRSGGGSSPVTDDAGNTVEVYFVKGGGSGSVCTQSNPCSYSQATSQMDGGDVLILLGGGGNIGSGNTTLALPRNSQVLGVGGSTSVTPVFNSDGDSLTFDDSNGRPVLNGVDTGAGTQTTLDATSNGERIAGIEIDGGERGIDISGDHEMTVNDVDMRGQSGDALHIEGRSGSSTLNIGANTIYDGGDVDIRNNSGVIKAERIATMGSGPSVVDIIDNNKIMPTEDAFLGEITIEAKNDTNVNINNSSFSSPESQSLNVRLNDCGSCSATVKNSSFNGRLTLTRVFSAHPVTVDGVTIKNPDGRGLQINNQGDVTVSNTTIDNTDTALFLNGPFSGSMDIDSGASTGNTITNTNDECFEISNINGQITYNGGSKCPP